MRLLIALVGMFLLLACHRTVRASEAPCLEHKDCSAGEKCFALQMHTFTCAPTRQLEWGTCVPQECLIDGCGERIGTPPRLALTGWEGDRSARLEQMLRERGGAAPSNGTAPATNFKPCDLGLDLLPPHECSRPCLEARSENAFGDGRCFDARGECACAPYPAP